MGRLKNGIRVDNIEPKICSKCGIAKSLNEYSLEKRQNNEMRYRGECKECRKIYRKKYTSKPEVREQINLRVKWRMDNDPGYRKKRNAQTSKSYYKHREKRLDDVRIKYWEDPELYRQKGRDFTANMTDEQREKRSRNSKTYREENKDKLDELRKHYYIENKEFISEKNKQYIKDNPEHCKKLRRAQYIKHQDRNINHQKNLRNKRRKLLREKLGGKCVGYNKVCGSTEKLEFDHIEPENKSFSIGQCLSKPLDLLLEEAGKCQLLCYKCHYEKTRDEWISGKLQIKVKKTKLKNKTL